MRRAALSLCLALSSWAQASPSPIPTSPPGEPAASSPQQANGLLEIAQSSAADSTALASRLLERRAQAQAQIERWQIIEGRLRDEIASERQSSADLSGYLETVALEFETSRMALTETSSLLGASRSAAASLSKDFVDYRAAAERSLRARSLKAGLWRVLALAGALGLGGALAGPALGAGPLQAAGFGALAGAAIGGVWMLAEILPKGRTP
jgi:hypothetical protein